jgi:cytochrome c6
MKKPSLVFITLIFLCSLAVAGYAKDKGSTGEELFKAHCTACHPDGSNIVNPKKTLHKKDREANNIKKPEDIVKIMRHPGPGMTAFDKATIPDTDAKKIAEHILKTFN